MTVSLNPTAKRKTPPATCTLPTMFCPGCGCETGLHDAVIRMGNEVIAHCSGCGPCWRSAVTPFLQAVIKGLARDPGRPGPGQPPPRPQREPPTIKATVHPGEEGRT